MVPAVWAVRAAEILGPLYLVFRLLLYIAISTSNCDTIYIRKLSIDGFMSIVQNCVGILTGTIVGIRVHVDVSQTQR